MDTTNTMSEASICVSDFCGTCHHKAEFSKSGKILEIAWHHPLSCWADYWPAQGVTRFGGAWYSVPDLRSDKEPTDEQIEAHVKASGWNCRQWYKGLLKAEASEITNLPAPSSVQE